MQVSEINQLLGAIGFQMWLRESHDRLNKKHAKTSIASDKRKNIIPIQALYAILEQYCVMARS